MAMRIVLRTPSIVSKHARLRNSRAALTALSSIGAKGLIGIISLLSIRLTLNYLGPERFGLWMTIASLQTVFSFTDFGLGNGVLHTVSEAYGRGDYAQISRAIRSALVAQIAIASALLSIFWSCFHNIGWAALFHVRGTNAAEEAAPTIGIFVSIFFIRSIIQVVQQAQFGLQAGYIANAWTAFGNLMAITGLYFCAYKHAGVPVLCLTVSGLPVVSGLLNITWWLTTRLPPLPKELTAFHRSHWPAYYSLLRSMLKTGLLFFLLQLTAQLNFGIDPLIVNQVVGSAAVSTLAIVQKPFDLLSIFILLLLQPLWPAYREAITTGDIPWVRNTFRRAMIASLCLATAFATLMALEGKYLIQIWVGSRVNVPELLIYAYCAAHLFSASQSPLAFFFNGLGKIRFQLFLAIPVIVISILLKVLLTPRLGLFAIPATTVFVGITIMLPAQISYVRLLFKELRRLHPGAPSVSQ